MNDSSPDAVPDYAQMHRLDGRNLLVAGAGAGIGRQVAHALRAAGGTVGCLDLDADLAAAVAAEVGGYPLVGDVCVEDEVTRVLEEAAAHGQLRGIVDIVGGARFVDICEIEAADWLDSQRLNVLHSLLLARSGGAAIAEAGGGSIVFIGSASGMTAAPHHAAYGMAKAALLALTKTAAVEFGPKGVRVNAVSPGIVWTPRMAAAIGDEREKWAAVSPLGRVALPSDVAATALFLVSDLSSYTKGQNLVVDGGVDVTAPYPIGDLHAKSVAARAGTP
jgi:NAD(P)-dependent dehydrogenase (short-subunit alcohol dehydrogenase family)